MFEEALRLSTLLHRAEGVFRLLETWRYKPGSALEAHCRVFWHADLKPSRELKRLNRVLGAAGLQKNPIAWLLVNAVLPWDMVTAWQLNLCKVQLAEHLPHWLSTWAELEALSALANFADSHNGLSWPELLSTDVPLLTARGLGHPLLADTTRVVNDFSLNQVGDVALLTGSNMAGKSTFLRAIGLNIALAYAGGPVVAGEFHMSPVRLFACIRVTDSVTDGISYFYAEVKRLKALLVNLADPHPYPLLYLIDEIFRGTNNRERLLGSRAYIEALLNQAGVGLIATHDLELVQLADQFPHIKNYHFRDAVADGQMYFDYRLRPGPCPTTNALKIMALEGLPVPAHDHS
jgi:DNA mismatch repair ATPase MutS